MKCQQPLRPEKKATIIYLNTNDLVAKTKKGIRNVNA